MRELNCPNCGGALQAQFQFSKLIVCEYCSSNIALKDDALKTLGTSAALTPLPSILTLHQHIVLDKQGYTPIGQLQYAYGNGRGLWEEWWAITDEQQGVWISIDEGDIVIQSPIDVGIKKPLTKVRIGDKIIDDRPQYKVTEYGIATLQAFAGELPEYVEIGSKHHYVHAESKRGELITLEQDAPDDMGNKGKAGIDAYAGKWLDPYDISGLPAGEF